MLRGIVVSRAIRGGVFDFFDLSHSVLYNCSQRNPCQRQVSNSVRQVSGRVFYFTVVILILSVLVQLLAAVIAWKQMRFSGKYGYAWACISIALLLMIVRRVQSLVTVIAGGSYDFPNEVIGLVISLMMVAGVWGLRLIFVDLNRKSKDLLRLATIDTLTGLANRNHIFTSAAQEIQRAIRTGHSLSLAIIDIDDFKSVNDRYGHAAGDLLLSVLGDLFKSTLRSGIDMAGRIGGEEFLLLLPETEIEQARQAMERLRASVANMRLIHDGHELKITICIGIAVIANVQGDSDALLKGLMRRADVALYSAKGAGRNRVLIWTTDLVDQFSNKNLPGL